MLGPQRNFHQDSISVWSQSAGNDWDLLLNPSVASRAEDLRTSNLSLSTHIGPPF
jgi:hypothetical protein